MIIIFIVVFVFIYWLFLNQNINEPFDDSIITTGMYGVEPSGPFQIGHPHLPFYNLPQHITRTKFYRHLFHPYGYASYY